MILLIFVAYTYLNDLVFILCSFSQLLGLFNDVKGCVSDSLKVVIFGEFETGAALKVKSLCNLGFSLF